MCEARATFSSVVRSRNIVSSQRGCLLRDLLGEAEGLVDAVGAEAVHAVRDDHGLVDRVSTPTTFDPSQLNVRGPPKNGPTTPLGEHS